MDYGIQFTDQEKKDMQAEAKAEVRKEQEEKGQLDKLAAEAAKAVDAKVRAEAEAAALDDIGLAESDGGAEAGPLDDEGYVSDGEGDGVKALAVAEGGGAGAVSSISDPVDTIDDASIGDGSIDPDSLDGEIMGCGPSTPLDSPLASIDEDPEDDGFVEGDDNTIPENKITPQGSTAEIQTDSELDGSLDGSLLPDDDGLSADQKEEKQRELNRKMVKLELKMLRKKDFAKMKEGDGDDVPAEGEDDPTGDAESDTVSISDPTPPTSSVPTPPVSTTSTEDAHADLVSTSDPTPPVSPIPSPEGSTANNGDVGPFGPQETDRQVLKNSAAKRVIAALFPDDQHSGSKIAAYDADKLIEAAVSAVEQNRFPNKDAKKPEDLANAYDGPVTVNEHFMIKLGKACADVAATSLESEPPGSLRERIVKQMEVNGTSVTGEQPAQSI